MIIHCPWSTMYNRAYSSLHYQPLAKKISLGICPTRHELSICAEYKIMNYPFCWKYILSFLTTKCLCYNSVVIDPHILTHSQGRLKWPPAVNRLMAHVACGLMSALVICKQRKKKSMWDLNLAWSIIFGNNCYTREYGYTWHWSYYWDQVL